MWLGWANFVCGCDVDNVVAVATGRGGVSELRRSHSHSSVPSLGR